MTTLVHKLGLSSALSFQDVYSLTDPTLLSFLPRPAAAILLVFPVTSTYEDFRFTEDKDLNEYNSSGPDEPVIWFKQTIRNACGLIGLLHAVCNGTAREMITPGSDLDKLVKDAVDLKPKERAELLYKSQALETAHQEAAKGGDTAAPDAESQVDLHFVCFVTTSTTTDQGKRENLLWELDGRRKGPLLRGPLGEDEDVLSEKGMALGIQSFLKREEDAKAGDLRFSCVALGPSMD